MCRAREGGSAREKCFREGGSAREKCVREGGRQVCVSESEGGSENRAFSDRVAVQQRDSSYDQMAWTGHKVQSTDVNNLKEEVRVMICAASLILPLSL